MTILPMELAHTGVPPVKCQGIKTKLVPFILRNVLWNSGDRGRWIEPFLGSGVVALNLAPERAILTDSNEHIIRLYREIQGSAVTPFNVRERLEAETSRLALGGADYYYTVRDRFNRSPTSFDFLFLNRSCFNGVMRFNRKGQFNVPFGHKPERFSKAYITKIANQVSWARRQMQGKAWEIRVSDWKTALGCANAHDFVYIDPPYIGRHTDYYNSWKDADAEQLAEVTKSLPCGFAVSMWLENRHRYNAHVSDCWEGTDVRTMSHFYHVGSHESLRNSMDEALLIKPGHSAECRAPIPKPIVLQTSLVLERKDCTSESYIVDRQG